MNCAAFAKRIAVVCARWIKFRSCEVNMLGSVECRITISRCRGGPGGRRVRQGRDGLLLRGREAYSENVREIAANNNNNKRMNYV